jgi:hypothetical protein
MAAQAGSRRRHGERIYSFEPTASLMRRGRAR